MKFLTVLVSVKKLIMLWLAINLSSLVKLFRPKLDCCTVFSVVAKYFYFFRELGERVNKKSKTLILGKRQKTLFRIAKVVKRPTRGPERLQKSYLCMNIFRKKAV